MYIIYIQELLKRMHKRVPTDKICTYCSMNNQYMKEVQNQKKVYMKLLDSYMVIGMLALRDNGFKEQKQNRSWRILFRAVI